MDSYSTITTAIEDATKLATLFLNTECLIVNEHNYQRRLYKILILICKCICINIIYILMSFLLL